MTSKIIVTLVVLCMSVPAYAAGQSQCEAMWDDMLNSGLGVLSEADSVRYLATMRSRDYPTPVDGELTPSAFDAACEADVYTLRKADQGAPFKGINRLSEKQAIDLALAHGFLNVLSFAQDDAGIWRGGGGKDGKSYRIAIDFRGNVVATMVEQSKPEDSPAGISVW